MHYDDEVARVSSSKQSWLSPNTPSSTFGASALQASHPAGLPSRSLVWWYVTRPALPCSYILVSTTDATAFCGYE